LRTKTVRTHRQTDTQTDTQTDRHTPLTTIPDGLRRAGKNMLRYKTETRPGLIALYDIRPGNGAGPFLQPRSPHGAEQGKENDIVDTW